MLSFHKARTFKTESLSIFFPFFKGKFVSLLVFRVSAGVDDAVHVQVQVVKFHLVGVWFGGVHGNLDPVTFFALKKKRKTFHSEITAHLTLNRHIRQNVAVLFTLPANVPNSRRDIFNSTMRWSINTKLQLQTRATVQSLSRTTVAGSLDKTSFHRVVLELTLLATHLLLQTMHDDRRVLSAEPTEKRRDSHLRHKHASPTHLKKDVTLVKRLKVLSKKAKSSCETGSRVLLHAADHGHWLQLPVNLHCFRSKWSYSDTDGSKWHCTCRFHIQKYFLRSALIVSGL